MSCKILYSAVLKFKPLKFSLYESRLSRILTKHHSRTTTASSQLEPPGARPCSSPCPAEGHPRPSGGREEDKDVAFRVITRAMSSCSVCSALGRQMGCYRVAGRFSGHSLCAQTHPLSSLQPPTAPHCQPHCLLLSSYLSTTSSRTCHGQELTQDTGTERCCPCCKGGNSRSRALSQLRPSCNTTS